MSEDEYTRLAERIERLQNIIRERQSKREPFISSFGDALENIAKRAREWFNEEADLAEEELEILKELFPDEDFSDDKSNLTEIMREFNETINKFNTTISSIKSGEIKSLKDIAEKEVFAIAKPEFIEDLSKLFNLSLKLEELIDSIEERARYIRYTQRIMEIILRRRSSS